MKATVREPAVAGMFYPSDSAALKKTVDDFLGAAAVEDEAAPKAIIVPHAGYIYSGPIAASAYACVAQNAISRVVLLGPSHRIVFDGLAAPEARVWQTSLGEVRIDFQALETLSGMSQVIFSDRVHEEEHSLEVQLPFLQEVFGSGFSLVPLAVGDAAPDEVADVLDALWGGEETLVVVSSDLSHYLSYEEARRADSATASAIERLDLHGVDEECACGRNAIRGLLRVAKRRGLRPRLLDLRNSGDTAGPRDQVVGYASFAFYESSV